MNDKGPRVLYPPNGCWVWNRTLSGNGYGSIGLFNNKIYLHRLSFRIFHGEIAPEYQVLHKCDNPACFNPEHLFLGTVKDNVADMIAKKRHNFSGLYRLFGKQNNKCKFSDDTVSQIRADYASGKPIPDIISKYNISKSHVARLVAHQQRRQVRDKPIPKS